MRIDELEEKLMRIAKRPLAQGKRSDDYYDGFADGEAVLAKEILEAFFYAPQAPEARE